MSSKQSNLFSVRTETNRNSICFGCFSVSFAKTKQIFFGLFQCFGPVSKQPKQTEKFSEKQISIRVSSKQLIYFSVRTETNRNSICFGCFSLCFAKTKQIFFGLFRCFGTVSKQPKQTKKFSKKQISMRVSSKKLIFFSVRPQTNRNSTCFGCFSVCFFAK